MSDGVKVGDTVRVCRTDTARYGQTGEVVRVGGDFFFPVGVRFKSATGTWVLGYFETDLQVVSGD